MAPVFKSPNLEIVDKWVMVPEGDFRLVEVLNATGMEFKPSNKTAVQILELTGSRVRASKQKATDIVDRLCPVYIDGNEKECSDLKTDARKRLNRIALRLKKQAGNKRILVILGKKENKHGKIRVLKNGKEIAHLYVSVAKPLTVRVGLFIIRHQPSGKTYVPHSSVSNHQLTEAVEFASAIWRQGAINLSIGQIGTADVPDDLGKIIDVRKETQDVRSIRSTKNHLKIPCVFVAKEILNDSHSSGKTFGNIAVFIDNKYKDKYLGTANCS